MIDEAEAELKTKITKEWLPVNAKMTKTVNKRSYLKSSKILAKN